MSKRIEINIEELGNKLFWLSVFRLLLLLVLITATLLVTAGTKLIFLLNVRTFLLWVGVIFSLISLFYIPIIYSFKKPSLILGICYFQMMMDTFFAGCITIVTGGSGSVFTFFFSLVIIVSSILLSRRGAIIFAFFSFLVMVIIGLFELNIIPAPPFIYQLLFFQNSLMSVLYNIGINSVAFFCIAFFASYLTEKLKKSDSLKKEIENKVKEMEEKIKEDEKLTIIGKLASVVAHEIRNPLASINGSIQLLSATYNFSDEDKKLVYIIIKEIEHLNNWINDLLGFARPVRGKMVQFELGGLIENVINFVKNDERFRNIEIEFQKKTDNCSIKGDEGRIRLVFNNILKNAQEAMHDEGKISIFVEKVEIQKKEFIKVSINDTGTGIEPENIPMVFEPFFTTKERGTGLGLATAYQIVQEHKGKIEILNLSEGGCCVNVYLPL